MMTMSYLELDESVDRSSLRTDHFASIDGPGIAGSRETLEVEQGGSDLIEIPGRVLLVEPAAGERRWLRNELIAGQMEVFEATDLITALRAVPMFQPNLILAQLRLPTYGGMELLYRLKRDSAMRLIPVLLYTDMATAEERIRALDLGAGDLVCRPFVGAELLARLRAALRTRHLLTVLEQRAHLDGLTGLANRRVLDDRLPREWEACRRRNTPLAVVISDLDHFKAINDRHGHAVGDKVLRQSAATLARVIRTSDFVARYGGEEFVVVAPDCELIAAVRLAERFRTAIAQLRIDEHGADVPVTTSVGVAALTDLDRTVPAELLRRADEALYRAKESGRNATWFWDQTRSSPAPAASDPAPEP
jgi:two-component system, cell cycle response regulator